MTACWIYGHGFVVVGASVAGGFRGVDWFRGEERGQLRFRLGCDFRYGSDFGYSLSLAISQGRSLTPTPSSLVHRFDCLLLFSSKFLPPSLLFLCFVALFFQTCLLFFVLKHSFGKPMISGAGLWDIMCGSPVGAPWRFFVFVVWLDPLELVLGVREGKGKTVAVDGRMGRGARRVWKMEGEWPDRGQDLVE
jgi:hypothetical protein